jgi:hypothetical protein
MDAERWQQIRIAFLRAGELSGEARDEHLRGLPESVSREVCELLAADSEAADFLEPAEPWLKPGSIMGSYEIAGFVAHGGMGEVYRAVSRTEPGQSAAIKVLGPLPLLRDAERRFAREQQILEHLSHPSIVRLLESGVSEGRQYLAMEWVDGLCLDEWSSGVPLDQRIRLFIEVCSAVHAAHQNLVVHRDLKPSNILVTPEGRPKLLDFGISRLLEASGGAPTATRTVLPAMTLAYCSPEQALNLPVGIPADIYSLGLLLFELASGKRAQDVTHLQLDQALRRITDDDLPRAEGIPQDLEAIIRKAAAKEPNRRYASALELGEDLTRFLGGYAVLARPATLRYTAAKFFRRHRTAVLAGAAGLALAFILLCALAYQFQRAQEERRKAERRFAAVQQLAQIMLFEAPSRIASIPGTIGARKWMVERALNYLAQLSSGAEGDPILAVTIAKGYRQVAFQQFNVNAPNLNDPGSAAKSLDQGMAVLDSAGGGGGCAA